MDINNMTAKFAISLLFYFYHYRVLFWKAVQVLFITWNAKKMRIDDNVSYYADLMELSIAW